MHQLSFIQFIGNNICSLICVKTRTLSCLASPYGDAHIQEARGQTLTLFQLKLVKTLFVYFFHCNQAKNFRNKKYGIYGLRPAPTRDFPSLFPCNFKTKPRERRSWQLLTVCSNINKRVLSTNAKSGFLKKRLVLFLWRAELLPLTKKVGQNLKPSKMKLKTKHLKKRSLRLQIKDEISQRTSVTVVYYYSGSKRIFSK